MNIREMRLSDLAVLKDFHQKHFAEEFAFPSFFSGKFVSSFVIVDDEDKIITGGGVRTIAESLLITNMNLPVKTRKEALEIALQASQYVIEKAGYDHLHAWVQDKLWEEHLRKVGFYSPVGNCLII